VSGNYTELPWRLGVRASPAVFVNFPANELEGKCQKWGNSPVFPPSNTSLLCNVVIDCVKG